MVGGKLVLGLQEKLVQFGPTKRNVQLFKVSIGWFSRFRKHNKFPFRWLTYIVQFAASLVDDTVDKSWNFILCVRGLHNYTDSYISNMDKTFVWIDMPGKSTLAPTWDKEVHDMLQLKPEMIRFNSSLARSLNLVLWIDVHEDQKVLKNLINGPF